jgi:hypothetical protein
MLGKCTVKKNNLKNIEMKDIINEYIRNERKKRILAKFFLKILIEAT